MLDRIETEPFFFAPFVSSTMTVEPAWTDYNGHLNMAYYHVLFDRGLDEAYDAIGIGRGYVKATGHSLFIAETHTRHLRELRANDSVRVTFQLLGYDAKRMHFFEQLFHASDGAVAATCEMLAIHIDMGKRRSAPFLPEAERRLRMMKEAHARLPRPEAAGRRISMPQ